MKRQYFKHVRQVSWSNRGHYTTIPSSTGGVTLCITEEDDVSAVVSYSVVNDKDHYNKAIGRAITKGRYDTDHDCIELPTYKADLAKGETIRDQLLHALAINPRLNYKESRLGTELYRTANE